MGFIVSQTGNGKKDELKKIDTYASAAQRQKTQICIWGSTMLNQMTLAIYALPPSALNSLIEIYKTNKKNSVKNSGCQLVSLANKSIPPQRNMNCIITQSSRFKIEHHTDSGKGPDQEKEDQQQRPSQADADQNQTDRSFLMKGSMARNFDAWHHKI